MPFCQRPTKDLAGRCERVRFAGTRCRRLVCPPNRSGRFAIPAKSHQRRGRDCGAQRRLRAELPVMADAPCSQSWAIQWQRCRPPCHQRRARVDLMSTTNEAHRGIAWVTGPRSGFGKALALSLCSEGWVVAASARRVSELQAKADETQDRSGRIPPCLLTSPTCLSRSRPLRK